MRSYRPLAAIIIGLSIIITAAILASAFRNRNRANESINVTGLAKKDFVSDLIVWNASFSKKAFTIKDAYSLLKKDADQIKQYLVSKGVKADQIIFSAVDINKEFDHHYNKEGEETQSIFTGYNLTQNVKIESREVEKIETISREVTDLIDQGVELYSNAPQYYYTKLAELKIQMLAEATKDARNRAEKIAENAGGGIDALRHADMGIFQITAQNSSEDYSYGGTFNTSAKNKTASVTVHLDFTID
jgi:hypothetical protein